MSDVCYIYRESELIKNTVMYARQPDSDVLNNNNTILPCIYRPFHSYLCLARAVDCLGLLKVKVHSFSLYMHTIKCANYLGVV